MKIKSRVMVIVMAVIIAVAMALTLIPGTTVHADIPNIPSGHGESNNQSTPGSCEINLYAAPEGAGTVEGAGEWIVGEDVTVKAVPETGYSFVRWMENGAEVSKDAEYTFTLKDNTDLTAVFEESSFELMVIKTDLSSLTVEARPSDTVADVKQKICEQTGIDAERQKLRKQNSIDTLNDDSKTMKELGIDGSGCLYLDLNGYVISFDPGEGTGEMYSVALAPVETTYGYYNPTYYVLPECDFTAPEGKVFKAWQSGTKEYQPGDKLYLNFDETVTALWGDPQVIELIIDPPVCGKENTVQQQQGGAGSDDLSTQTYPPKGQVTTEGYKLEGILGWVSETYVNMSLRTTYGKVSIIGYRGSFTGGDTYYVLGQLVPDDGHTLPDFFQLVVNGRLIAANYIFEVSGRSKIVFIAQVEAVHDWDDGEITTFPTCTSRGEKTYHCKAEGCTAKKTEPVDIDQDAHDWDDWTVTKPATCTEKGEKDRICRLNSNHKETEEIAIDPDAHTWRSVRFDWIGLQIIGGETTFSKPGVSLMCKNDPAHTLAVPSENVAFTRTRTEPDCDKDGSVVYTASADYLGVTGEESQTVTLYALGHEWGDWVVTKEATETEEGEKVRTCKRDSSHTETAAIPKLADYTISFDPGQGEGSMADETARNDGSYHLPQCGFTNDDGSAFKEWDLNGIRYSAGDEYIPDGDVTFTAIWSDAKYTGPTGKHYVEVGDSRSFTYKATEGQFYWNTAGGTIPQAWRFLDYPDTFDENGDKATDFTVTFTPGYVTGDDIGLHVYWIPGDSITYSHSLKDRFIPVPGRTSIDDISDMQLEEGDEANITPVVRNIRNLEINAENGYTVDVPECTFTSSDETVATVDADGKIKALKGGNAAITVSFGGNKSYKAAEDVTFTVTVPYKKSTVTFKVNNGTWKDDGSTVKTYEIINGSTITDIPVSEPDSGYGTGEWDTEPSGQTVNEDLTFTYTYLHYPVLFHTEDDRGKAPGPSESVWFWQSRGEVIGSQYYKQVDSGDDNYIHYCYNDEYGGSFWWFTDPADLGTGVGYTTPVNGETHLYNKWVKASKLIESVSVNVTAQDGDTIPVGQMIDISDLPDFYLSSPFGEDYMIGWAEWENPDGDVAFEEGKTYKVRLAVATGDPSGSDIFFKGHQSAKTGEDTYDTSKAYSLSVNSEASNNCIQDIGATMSMIEYEYTVPHKHKLTRVGANAATCEADGNTEYWICDQGTHPCGKYFRDKDGRNEIKTEDTVMKSAGHTEGAPVREKEKPATCTTEGSYDEVVYCTACSTELSRKKVEVPALGHDWDEWKQTTAPTESTDGEEERICKHDADHKETRKIPALGHTHDLEYVAENEAGCTASGMAAHYKCKKCGLYYADKNASVQINEEALMIPPKGHTDGGKTKRVIKEANCTEDGSYYDEVHCKVCGELLSSVLMTEPAFGHDWDEWKVSKAAACTQNGEEKRACKHDKTHTEVREISATGHDWDEWKVTRDATCTQEGEEKRVCKHDDTHEETRPVKATGHKWGEWKEIKAATETEEGEEKRNCINDPSHKETRTIAALDHKHKLTKVEAEPADCDEDGHTEYWICSEGDKPCGRIFADAEGKKEINIEDTVFKAKGHSPKAAARENEVPAGCETEGSYDEVVCCENCGEELSREKKTIAATGHSWDDGKVTTEPVCGVKGVRTFTCKHDSSHTRTEEIRALDHDWDAGKVTAEPTCNGKGVKTFTCKHDSSHTRTEEISALGHDWGNWKVTREATETEEGVETRICKHDESHAETRSIPVEGHVHKPGDPVRENEIKATCETEGSYDEVVYCTACSTELSRKKVEVSAFGHDWSEWKQTKVPTENTDGEEERICKNDADHKETRKIPALGHTHDLEYVAENEAGCTASGMAAHYKCKKCGLYYADKKASVQINEEALVIPPKGHTDGGKTKRVVKEASCTEDGSYSEEVHCKVCGELLSSELMTEPAFGHDWDEWKVSKAATCTQNGEEKRICKHDMTHTEVRDISATGHDWDGWKVTKTATCTLEGEEKRVCKHDDTHEETRAVKATGHKWGEWKDIKAATETEDGAEERICINDPSHKETRTIPALDHKHKLTKVEAKPADCDEDGNTGYWICSEGDKPCGRIFADAEGKKEINKEDTVVKTEGHSPKDAVKENKVSAGCETEGSYDEVIYCEHCDEELSREKKPIAATGHSWDDGKVTTEPTCGVKGVKTFTCKHDSSHTRTEEIAALEHDWDDGKVTTEPTCNGKGVKTFTCKHNSSHTRTEEISALGHDWGDWKVTKEATETEEGVETRICKHDADHKETRKIPALVHTHDLEYVAENEAGCTASGMAAHYKCKKCGLYYADKNASVQINEEALMIPPKGHTDGDKTKRVVKEASCTEDGSYYEEAHCKVCGELLSSELMTDPTFGHNWDEWKVSKAATCTMEGEEKRVCKHDNTHEETRVIKATGHEWDEWKVSKAATCTMEGEEKRVCKHDDTHEETRPIKATGHKWGEWKEIKAATETEEGEEERSCINDPSHKESRTIPALGHKHKLIKVEAKPADCDEDGHTEYWICSEGEKPCGRIFADAEGKKEINIEDTIIKAKGHSPKEAVRENEVPSGCETEGSYNEVIYCEHCGEELSRGKKIIAATGHSWDDGKVTVEATCGVKGVRTFTCKHDSSHTRTEEIRALEHDWDDGKVTTEPTCNGKGVKTFTCKHDNSHTRTEEIAALGHDWGEWKVTKEATETEEGVETRICKHDESHAETRSIPVAGHVHKPGEPVRENEVKATCENEGSYDEVICCTACSTELSRKKVEVPATGHDWDEWKQTKSPTETSDGEEERSCKNDPSEKETRKIPALGHVHQLEYAARTEPGCETFGQEEHYKCSKCGLLYADDKGEIQINEEALVIPPAGHTEGEVTKRIVKEAICTEEGSYYEEIHCKVCGVLLKDELKNAPAPGHDWDDWKVSKEASCAGAGEEKRICRRDSAHFETREITATGHDWGEWKITKAATQEEEGEETRTCKTDLTHTETRSIPVIGHVHVLLKVDAVAPDCHNAGNTEYWICSIGEKPCGHIFADPEGKTEINIEDTLIPPVSHESGSPVRENETAAGCEEDGSFDEVVYCGHCGEELSREKKTITATGHSWDEGKVTTEPTCNGKGVRTFTCKNDVLHTLTEEIEALGHDWGEWKTTRPATETEDGEEERVCRHDESHRETRIIPKKDTEPGEISYSNTKGDGNRWTKGSGVTSDFEFKRSENDEVTFEHYTGTKVDGVNVAESDLIAEPGSVIVKLKPAYLETLALGVHTITAEFDDGNSASAEFTILAKAEDKPGEDEKPGSDDIQGGDDKPGEDKKPGDDKKVDDKEKQEDDTEDNVKENTDTKDDTKNSKETSSADKDNNSGESSDSKRIITGNKSAGSTVTGSALAGKTASGGAVTSATTGSAATGDTDNIYIWITIALATSALGVAVAGVYMKKRKNK